MIEHRIKESIDIKQRLLNDQEAIQAIQRAIQTLCDCFGRDKHVWLCGNGGSAADAQHIAAELSGRFLLNRSPLAAESFTVNSSYLTAVANDFSFDDVFSRMVMAQCKEGDVLVAISTSGNSRNVVRAVETAKMTGVKTIALTGDTGGELKSMADLCICVPGSSTPRIQEAHILIGHIICEGVESILFGNS